MNALIVALALLAGRPLPGGEEFVSQLQTTVEELGPWQRVKGLSGHGLQAELDEFAESPRFAELLVEILGSLSEIDFDALADLEPTAEDFSPGERHLFHRYAAATSAVFDLVGEQVLALAAEEEQVLGEDASGAVSASLRDPSLPVEHRRALRRSLRGMVAMLAFYAAPEGATNRRELLLAGAIGAEENLRLMADLGLPGAPQLLRDLGLQPFAANQTETPAAPEAPMSTREERAASRRARWRGEVVEPSTPKPLLLDSLTPVERMQQLARLNERVWVATGQPLPEPLPREQWPGEVFEIDSCG